MKLETNEMHKQRRFVRNKILKYNKSRNKKYLKKIFNRLDFCIEPNLNIIYGNVTLGKKFYANFNCTFLDDEHITIGDNVMLGPNVCLCTVNHPFDIIKRRDFYICSKPINIGNDVWIGANSIILPGITIGNNVIIGAGSVVTKDIPDNQVWFGNPAKFYKNI